MGPTRHRIPFSSTLKDRAAFQLLHNRAAGLDSGGGTTLKTATDANAYDISLRLQVRCVIHTKHRNRLHLGLRDS